MPCWGTGGTACTGRQCCVSRCLKSCVVGHGLLSCSTSVCVCRVTEVVGLYKQHVHGRDMPDWDAFMRGVVGNDVQLKVKQVSHATSALQCSCSVVC